MVYVLDFGEDYAFNIVDVDDLDDLFFENSIITNPNTNSPPKSKKMQFKRSVGEFILPPPRRFFGVFRAKNRSDAPRLSKFGLCRTHF